MIAVSFRFGNSCGMIDQTIHLTKERVNRLLDSEMRGMADIAPHGPLSRMASTCAASHVSEFAGLASAARLALDPRIANRAAGSDRMQLGARPLAPRGMAPRPCALSTEVIISPAMTTAIDAMRFRDRPSVAMVVA